MPKKESTPTTRIKRQEGSKVIPTTAPGKEIKGGKPTTSSGGAKPKPSKPNQQ